MSTPVQNADGKWVIPASQRPDGTWRKEIFVKEGYVVSFLIVINIYQYTCYNNVHNTI